MRKIPTHVLGKNPCNFGDFQVAKNKPGPCFSRTSRIKPPVHKSGHSIMEGMAAGVLPIAPDVGGMADIVSNDFGVLMSKKPDGPTCGRTRGKG